MQRTSIRIPQVKQVPSRRRGNRKLIGWLVLFFLTILAILFFRSPYSKVQTISVYGTDMYDPASVIDHSGLSEGMQYLNVWDFRVKDGLKRLKGIKEVKVVRDFPGTIRLEIQEYKRVAFWTESDGTLYPLLENGVILTDPNLNVEGLDRPIIREWKDKSLLPGLANALAKLSPALLAEISDISLTPTPYDKSRITLYMRDGNEVRTVIHLLAKRMVWYPAIIKEIPEGQKGVLHLLESTWFRGYQEDAGQEEAPNDQQKETEDDENS